MSSAPLGPGENYMDILMPKMPPDTDFETFRKTDPQWLKLVKWYNDQQHPRAQNDEHDGEDSESVKRSTLGLQTRFILQHWPRDPNGKSIDKLPEGKHTNNRIPLWGATLYDFYMVKRFPDVLGLLSLASGSRLAAWAKENGEADSAQGQIQQADAEEEPRLMPPYPIEKFIELIELLVHLKKTGKSLEIDKASNQKSDACLLPPQEYPGRWPLKPFSTPTYRLQESILLSDLPQKLIVHDPWNCLLTSEGDRELYRSLVRKRGSNDGETSDGESNDGERNDGESIVNRSPGSIIREIEQMKEDNGEIWRWGSRPDNIYTYSLCVLKDGEMQQDDDASAALPAGGVTVDAPEAHLYITPKRRIGVGHHSFVYQVELELPRSLLVKPKSCVECSIEDETPAIATEDVYESLSGTGTLVRDVKPLVEHVEPPYCKHLDDGVPRPKTARVSVSAKLTIPNDHVESHAAHLHNEARTYMKLPEHLFEHWNGYIIVQPLHDPVPVGAVVPQFYGYYVPDAGNKPKEDGVFMSPILLLEHCGVQVKVAELPLEDRNECVSLLRRLHFAGFKHNSTYERNILMQHGPVQNSPFERSDMHRRFRLIDFGRTTELENDLDAVEEYEVASMHLKLELSPYADLD